MFRGHFQISLAIICFLEALIENNQTRLYKELFQNYEKYSHPVLNPSDVVKVVFDFQLIRVIDVNAKDQFIKTYAWINQYWNNPQLKWDPKKYEGIEEIHISPLDVWVPDILLYDNVDEEDWYAGGRHSYKTNVKMKFDGSTSWLSPGVFKSICKVDVTYFPFDEQECFLKFGSWSFDSSKVDLYEHKGNLSNKNYIKNGEWKLTYLKSQRNERKYQCCPRAFVDVTIHMKLQRESLDFVLKLIIPCSLISSMIFLGFVLPPESGERIGLSITVLLAMTVFQQLSSELMPSYGFPLLGQYYFACMVEIGASLFVTTLILNFYHRNSRRMPRALRVLLLRWLARVVFPQKSSKDWNLELSDFPASSGSYQKGETHTVGEDSDSNDSSFPSADSFFKEHDGKARAVSNLSDPWIPMQSQRFIFGFPPNSHSRCFEKTCESSRKEKHDMKSEYTGCNSKRSLFGHEDRKRRKASKHCEFPGPSNSPRKKGSLSSSTSGIAGLNFPNEDGLSGLEKLKNQKEWIKAARVLDRLFLIVSILIGIATLLALFLKAPRFH
ncbi:Neuronal acetylcholine receptor subunit alpha-7 [Acropora cervicornis]|uniref:Neuronal acetylcholine receptor subunit alpha-7 n=1 Tax=Acropora cervicornis TaxID=6130 RepID=A0AAD9R6H4_ACRCE|nr:Neuronal acetylcholine receptor subunit alpha-7 [Acropora cervicornis]